MARSVIPTSKRKGELPNDSASRKKTRVTLIVDEIVDRNVELLCIITGRQKTEVVNDALISYLKGKQIDPHEDQSSRILALLTHR